MKENLLISACLCGANCKYNGGNNLIKEFQALKDKYNLVYICPEALGDLKHPRCPSEIINSKVYGQDGIDVTKNFIMGAQKSLEICLKNGCKKALLKESSPSCGVHFVYDGTFSHKKIEGMGITAKLLKENNIELYSENDVELLL